LIAARISQTITGHIQALTILASTEKGSWILDPFTGSSTTGIAANLLKRKFLGIDKELEFLEISKARKKEIEVLSIAQNYKKKIQGFHDENELDLFLLKEPETEYIVNEIKGITNKVRLCEARTTI